MTTPDNPSPQARAVEVTQADREAAADLIERYWSGAGAEHDTMRRLAQSCRSGHSQGVWAIAFARHRVQAEADALEKAAKVADDFADMNAGSQAADVLMAQEGALAIGRAIRSLKEQDHG